MGQAEQERQNGRAGHAEQDSQIGQAALDRQSVTGRTRQEYVYQNRIGKTG